MSLGFHRLRRQLTVWRQIIQWAETRYPSWISLGGPAPMYRDQPEAVGVHDVRVQQQPAKSPIATRGGGGGATGAGGGAAGQTKPGIEDFKFMMLILGAVFGVMILSFAAIIGGVYFFLPAQYKAITTE